MKTALLGLLACYGIAISIVALTKEVENRMFVTVASLSVGVVIASEGLAAAITSSRDDAKAAGKQNR